MCFSNSSFAYAGTATGTRDGSLLSGNDYISRFREEQASIITFDTVSRLSDYSNAAVARPGFKFFPLMLVYYPSITFLIFLIIE